MTSKQYWKTRSILLEQLLHDRSEVTAQRISRLYGLAQERIFQRIEKVFSNYVKGGTLTEAEAMRLLTVKETEEVLTDLRQMYLTAEGPAKKAIWARLSAPAYSYRISRLQALRDELYAQSRMMGLEEVSYVRDRLSDTLEQSYYRTTFDIQHFTGEYYDFDRLTDRQIKAALAADWNGKNWSNRIWNNNQMFADAVEDTVTTGIMTGQRYAEMRDNLMHVIGLDDTEGARYKSARLVQTECAYVANHGHLMGYEAAGIERYIFLATLDLRTSEICRSLDGKRFPVNEAQPGTNYPPMHPWCRSTTMPDMSAEQLRKVKRAARDPKTGKSITVPGDMTYQEWYRKYVEGQGILPAKGLGRKKAKAEPLVQVTIEGWNSEQTRRRIGSQGQEIIDKPTFQKLTREFRRRGGIIIRGKDAERHLKKVGAYASYLPGANAAFIRDDATVSDVLEEMYHAEQERTAMFGSVQTPEVTLRREIDAQKHLLSLSERYKISLEEVAVTKSNLDMYEKRLDELLNGGE